MSADATNPKAELSSGVFYVQFREPVSVTGADASALASWSRDRHGRDIECVVKGNFVVLTCKDGSTREVPWHNVIWVSKR